MLWLALHLPQLSLEAFCATLAPQAAQRPVALLQAHRLSHVNAAATACGLRPGLKRATALALAPELLIAEAHTARDAAALQAVAFAALAFTPAVALHDAQTVLLEVQASLRLFGGLAALHRRLLQALQPLGHGVQMAAAPTAAGAALLAQWPEAPAAAVAADADAAAPAPALVLGAHAHALPALRALLQAAPVGLLAAGREHAAALQGMGLHTLGELAALPRGGLARRFGEALLDELDRALGRRADPRRWLALPDRFESRLELQARADTSAQVLHGAGVLLARLVAWAQARHARVAAFTLRMLHERQRQAMAPPTELHLALAEPALDPTHLQALLRERLGRCTLQQPTLELQLLCHDWVAGHAPNAELFPTPGSQAEGLGRLLERLRARLGDGQVQRLLAVADHRPERASHRVPAQGEPGELPAAVVDVAPLLAAAAASSLPLHRPVWLLPDALPLAEREALPLLQGRPLQLLSGPERIETGWWDADPVARDYFIAQAEDGSLVWVYRGRLPALPGEVHWFLQGRFA